MTRLTQGEEKGQIEEGRALAAADAASPGHSSSMEPASGLHPDGRVSHSAGPWRVCDMRASEMRRLGWTGPAIDRLLIVNKTAPEIIESEGDNCVVARIQFDNRTEELTEGNLADARLIAAAPELLEALETARDYVADTDAGALRYDDGQRVSSAMVSEDLARIEAALAKARGQ